MDSEPNEIISLPRCIWGVTVGAVIIAALTLAFSI